MNDTVRIISHIDALIEKKQSVCIAIDGRCGSGKTTMAELLAKVYEASIIHMDDFFLPLELRTEKRLEEPGGNIHYERFMEEVYVGLKYGEGFSYHVFDCSIMGYGGVVNLNPAPLVIVEGSYSLRPEFRDLYDVKVFMNISPEEQKQRIIRRNGEKMYKNFEERWIPMEEKYFRHYNIIHCSDIIISA